MSAPCLWALAKQDGVGSKSVETLIKIHLVSLDAFLKQKNGLSKEEIELIAEEIMGMYGGALNFADIHVIFRNAKIGKYGELYGNLSCMKIMKWFEEYFSERCNKAYEINLQKDIEKYKRPTNLEGDELLRRMGYVIGEDGRVCVDAHGNAMVDKKQVPKNTTKPTQSKPKSNTDKDAEYRAWKAQYIAQKMREAQGVSYTEINEQQ